VSKDNGCNGYSKKTEAKITCRKKRCGKRFAVKVGKNDGCIRTCTCPYCGTVNTFSVDENGKVHGPAAF